MPSKISAALLLLIMIGAGYELYLDATLTKYYLLSLYSHKPYHVCALSEPKRSVFVYDQNLTLVQPLFVPPFYTLTTKSLSSQPHCFTLFSHYEGFSPGSLIVRSPLHQSRWTLSYSGRLAYNPATEIASDPDLS
jgi:hypothetical protein